MAKQTNGKAMAQQPANQWQSNQQINATAHCKVAISEPATVTFMQVFPKNSPRSLSFKPCVGVAHTGAADRIDMAPRAGAKAAGAAPPEEPPAKKPKTAEASTVPTVPTAPEWPTVTTGPTFAW